MDKCAFWKTTLHQYERELAQTSDAAEQLRLREAMECASFILSICRQRVADASYWERQKRVCMRFIKSAAGEAERERLNNHIRLCDDMEQTEIARARERLDARIEAEHRRAELAQDRREVEGLLAQVQREMERERASLPRGVRPSALLGWQWSNS